MSDKSNNQGRAYEYACLLALKEALGTHCPITIIENSSLEAAKRAWDKIDSMLQQTLAISARAAVKTLYKLEPNINEKSNQTIKLSIQNDKRGEQGDIRDILIVRRETRWEIGLSLKHNHFAVKHSRLAKDLDFGAKWFGIPCSDEYWKDVKPIFDFLEEERKNKTKWNELKTKSGDAYLPLLNAFMREIKRSYRKNPSIPRKMVEYLLGKYDFYKVISLDRKRQTQIQAVNLRGTLNQSSPTSKPTISIPTASLPTEIIDIRIKPNCMNKVELFLNKGWQFSFRIHNASTIVEPSLKFDIQFEGLPLTIVSINTPWDNQL